MAKRSLAHRLDLAVEALLARPGDVVPVVDTQVKPFARLASALRGLPRQSFRRRLKAELAGRPASKRGKAGEQALNPRKGVQTVTLYLTTAGIEGLVSFVKEAFGAVETFRAGGSAGGIHVEVHIRDSMLMLGGGAAVKPEDEKSSGIHLYVEDADAVYRRALAAGATSLAEPVDQFYGDREASVRDPAGNRWYIATHNRETGARGGEGNVPEGLRAVTPYLHPQGAAACIDFLKQAFGAEEVVRDLSPDGVVRHAKVRIGNSIVEMGEAHGPWQPMPTAIYLHVSDVDAVYRRAVAAGAASRLPPTDQPYGSRNAWVKDPFGHTWYIASPIRATSR